MQRCEDRRGVLLYRDGDHAYQAEMGRPVANLGIWELAPAEDTEAMAERAQEVIREIGVDAAPRWHKLWQKR